MKVSLQFLLVIAVATLAALLAQGPLTPPGAPTPTMKTLQQIEPRIDIQTLAGDADYHHIITQAGSYYLSANLFVTRTNGIYVRLVAGVTIDLNGFEIRRTSGSGGDGITISSVSHRASIRNGSIKGFSFGIQSFNSGNYAGSCAFRDIAVSSCTFAGIYAGESAVLESCRAHDNSGTYGIFAGTGSSITNCTASSNTTTYGMSADGGCSLTNCSASDNTGGEAILAGNGSSLTNCSANNNTATHGISAAVGCSLTNCSAYNNTAQYGIFASAGSSFTNCSAYKNTSATATSAGIGTGPGSTVTSCTAYSNTSSASVTPTTGMGFDLGYGSTIQNCTATLNRGDGIHVLGRCIVRENNSDFNGSFGDGAGIHATADESLIESNKVSNNHRGIDVDDVRNLVIRNMARNNSGMNYVIVTGNRVGAIVVPPLSGDIAGDTDPDAAGAGTTDPWANFTY